MPDAEAAPNGAAPLAELHRSLGAELEPTPLGWELPIHFGSVRDEYNALRQSCGLVDRSWVPTVEVTGEDRVRFVNGLVTCDVHAPGPGAGTYGFFTDAKGKVLADVAVLVEEDRLLLELSPGAAQPIVEHMRKYVITDRVEVREIEEELCLAVVGPTAGRALDRLVGSPVPRDDWHHRRIELLGHEVGVSSHPNLGVAAWILRIARDSAEALFRGLMARRSGGELPAVGHQATEAVRVEGGDFLPGIDLDPDTLPQETGYDEAISYTKGCYLGQEIVARIHYRGQVNRHLRGLRFEADEVPEAGSGISFEGAEVGKLTSPIFSPQLGQPIGLALIHRKASDPGTPVELASGAAEVTELPFVHRGVA